ncbi:cytochrome P450 71A8-like isoform X2 [Andrographis paniculata]|uniref:cytochrome P450 71A8-like isoform X2 n=1 Tax=Andrographis paniculata TaxID=175694 RepID=UPI0021E70557|nr:cytochrome P450 71A8-like isoform X2 [Andrographis paniculata]
MSKFLFLMDAIKFNPFVFQALATFFLFWFIYKWFHKPNGATKLPPLPPTLPIIGNLHQFRSLPHRDLQRLARKYGPLMHLHLGSVPMLVVSSGEGAKEIMKTNDPSFADRPQTWVAKQLLYGTHDVSMSPYDQKWRQRKSICVLQLLSNKRVQSLHAIREEETSLLLKKIEHSSSALNLSEMFAEFSNAMISRAIFGQKCSEGEKGKRFVSLLKDVSSSVGTIYVGDFIPWLSFFTRVNGFNAKVQRVAKELDEFLEGVIQERMARTQEEKAKDDGMNKYGENFVDILIDIYKNNSYGISISKENVKGILMNMIEGGTYTVSIAQEWMMSEILRHPEVLKRLQAEVRGILKDRVDITDHDLEKMTYLKAVIKETLRLHPPIPLPLHKARNDVKLMGYEVSAGTWVAINIFAIGRDPKIWDEPEKFNPDRFLNSSIDFKGQDFELIPFSSGRRGCPGISFAMANIEYTIANLVQKFEWKLAEDGKELDMTERQGLHVGRAVPLLALASKYQF